MIGFIALCQSRSSKAKRGIFRHPASVLAPESALGSLPSVALSSAQVDLIVCELEKHACFTRKHRSNNPRPASLEMAGFEWPQMAGFGVATEAGFGLNTSFAAWRADGLWHLIEQERCIQFPKLDVAGSIPVSRSWIQELSGDPVPAVSKQFPKSRARQQWLGSDCPGWLSSNVR